MTDLLVEQVPRNTAARRLGHTSAFTYCSVATAERSDDAGAEESRSRPRRVGGKLGWCKEHPLRVRCRH